MEASSILNVTAAKLTDQHILRLTSADMPGFMGASDLPRVLLFSESTESSQPYRALSMEFSGKVTFATIHANQTLAGTLDPRREDGLSTATANSRLHA